MQREVRSQRGQLPVRPSQRAKLWAKLLLTVLVSLLFVYLFLQGIDLEEVADALVRADYVYVPFALLLFAASLVPRALRWQVFYRPEAVPLRTLFPVLLVTYAGNNLLPLRAGEIVRAQLLRDRAGISRLRTLGTAAVERLFDFAVLGSFVLLGVFLGNIGFAFAAAGLLLAGGSLLGLVVGWAFVRRPEALEGALSRRIVPQAWRERAKEYGELVLAGLGVLRSPASFRDAAALTVAAWLLEFGMYYLMALSFSLGESYLTIAFAGAAANLALSVPFSQAGVGPFQTVTKEALLRFGVAANAAAAYAIALHVVLVGPVSVAGLLVLWATLQSGSAMVRRAIVAETTDPVA